MKRGRLVDVEVGVVGGCFLLELVAVVALVDQNDIRLRRFTSSAVSSLSLANILLRLHSKTKKLTNARTKMMRITSTSQMGCVPIGPKFHMPEFGFDKVEVPRGIELFTAAQLV